MGEADKVLDELWAAALKGDHDATVFLHMFAPWALALPQQAEESAMNSHHRRCGLVG